MTPWAEVSAALLGRPRSAPDSPHTARERTAALLGRLGDPQRTVPAIHLAGTNGKSSTARIADALLRAAGLRTACVTSPHLRDLAERITLAGVPFDGAALVRAHDRLVPAIAATEAQVGPLAFFDVVCALAFVAIAAAAPDVMVIEVGVGGREDATDVLDAATVAITPIGLDHVDALGGSLRAIAEHKAGIITRGARVVLGPQDGAVEPILERAIERAGAVRVPRGRLLTRRPELGGQRLDVELDGVVHSGLGLGLLGAHQAENALTAIAAVQAHLRRPLEARELQTGLGRARVPGRLEPVAADPLTLLDVTHNPAGMAVTAAALAEAFTGGPRPVAVFGAARGKDGPGMLAALGEVVEAVVLTAWGPDAQDPDVLARCVRGPVRVVRDPEAALTAARSMSRSGVVVTGSHRLAGALSRTARAAR